MPVRQLNRLVWTPVRASWLWAAGVGIGLVGGFATLELNPRLAIPLALAWVYVGYRQPRLVGIAGALVGHGAAWIWLLLNSGVGGANTQWWTLPYGPTHTDDLEAWRAETWHWIAFSAVLLILGIVLTVQLARRLRGPQVGAPELWVAGVVIGLLSGFAIVELNLLLAIPLALVWVYLGLRRPRLVGIAGALIGLAIEWIWLLATAETWCLDSLPPVCGWSLPYGPSWSSDPNAWSTLEQMLTVMTVALLVAGIALTVRFAWRTRGREQRSR
jgi:hypothetical protein